MEKEVKIIDHINCNKGIISIGDNCINLNNCIIINLGEVIKILQSDYKTIELMNESICFENNTKVTDKILFNALKDFISDDNNRQKYSIQESDNSNGKQFPNYLKDITKEYKKKKDYDLFISARTCIEGEKDKSLEYKVGKKVSKFFNDNGIATFWWEDCKEYYKTINEKIALSLVYSKNFVGLSFSNDLKCLNINNKILNYFSYEIKTFRNLHDSNNCNNADSFLFETDLSKFVPKERKMLFCYNQDNEISFDNTFLNGIAEMKEIETNDDLNKICFDTIQFIVDKCEFKSKRRLIKKAKKNFLNKNNVIYKIKEKKVRGNYKTKELLKVIISSPLLFLKKIYSIFFSSFVRVTSTFLFIVIPLIAIIFELGYFLDWPFVRVITFSNFWLGLLPYLFGLIALSYGLFFLIKEKCYKILHYSIFSFILIFELLFLVLVIVINYRALNSEDSNVINYKGSILVVDESDANEEESNVISIKYAYLCNNESKLPLKLYNKIINYNIISALNDNSSVEFEKNDSVKSINNIPYFDKSISSIIFPDNIIAFEKFILISNKTKNLTIPAIKNININEKFIFKNDSTDDNNSNKELTVNINGGYLDSTSFDNNKIISYIKEINVFSNCEITSDAFDNISNTKINISNNNYNKIKDSIDNKKIINNNVCLSCYDVDDNNNRIDQDYKIKIIDENGIETVENYKYNDEVKFDYNTKIINGRLCKESYYFDDIKIDSFVVTRDFTFKTLFIPIDGFEVKVMSNDIKIEGEKLYKPNEEVVLNAENVPFGYVGEWRFDDKVEIGNKCCFEMPFNDIEIEFVTHKVFDKVDEKISFGRYPQSKVLNQDLINTLNETANNNSNEWKDFGYYNKGTVDYYMQYIDLDIDNDNLFDYRGIYFTSYRPYDCQKESTKDNSYMSRNGYDINTIYWFKYEEISWDIVKKDENKLYLISEFIIDNQEFYPSSSSDIIITDLDKYGHYASNYYYSTIKQWLTENIYEKSFDDYQRNVILKSSIRYSKTSAASAYVYLPTESEIKDYYARDIDRIAESTDYSISQGLSSNSWLLCTSSTSNGANWVSNSGKIYSGIYGDINVSNLMGIRPVICIEI